MTAYQKSHTADNATLIRPTNNKQKIKESMGSVSIDFSFALPKVSIAIPTLLL
jgi:hypothetical protein